MYKFLTSNFCAIFWALVFLFVPQGIFAAQLSFDVIPNTSTSTPTLVEVRIDPQSKRLNVIEGTLKFSGDASNNIFVQVENGQSILPMWPTPPEYNKDQKSIQFTGGVPNGFDAPGLLFKLRISSSVSGDLSISYTDGSAYLNDGKGTKESIDSKVLTVHVDKVFENKTKNTPLGFNGYVIILVSILVVLIVIFKYAFKRNDEQ